MKYYTLVFTFLLALPLYATKLYNKCKSCHGKDAMGRKAVKAPRLAGQKAWYTEEQLKLFKSRERKGGRSRTMYPVARRLSEKQMKELGKYLESLD